MTDPPKPRRKVASQISASSTPSSTPNRQPFKPTVRAKVTPGNIATPPSRDDRPGLQRPPSASSIRSYVTAPPSVSRARSPVTPAISPSTVSRIAARPPQRSPLTGVSRSSPAPGPSGTSTPTIARVKARSVIGSSPSPSSAPSASSSLSSRQTPEAQVRRNAADKAASAQMVGRTRTNSLRSAVSTNTTSGGERAPVARLRPTKAASTPDATSLGIPSSAPSPTRIAEPSGHTSPAPVNGLGVDGAIFASSGWPQTSSPPSHSPYAIPLPAPPMERSPTSSTSITTNRTIQIPHPTASAPTSPAPGSSHRLSTDAPLTAPRARGWSKSRLPAHAFVHQQQQQKWPPGLPLPPSSPELRPVALPVLTPGVSTPGSSPGAGRWGGHLGEASRGETGQELGGEEWERERKGSEGSGRDESEVSAGLLSPGSGSGRQSLSRALRQMNLGPNGLPYENGHKIEGLPGGESLPNDTDHNGLEAQGGEGGEGGDRDDEVDDMLGGTAEQAKINRKIADLEISNASLMAINKMLETTKSKQRAEIVKLRRRLRETLSHHPHPNHHPSHPHSALSPLSASSFPHPQTSPTLSALTFDEDPDHDHLQDDYHDAEMADPQLDARWDSIQTLVLEMQEKAREAVKTDAGRTLGKEREGVGGGRVLGWVEVEARDREDGDGEGDVSVDSEGTPVETIIDDLLGGEGEGEESGTDDERPPRRGSF
ncbi:hypothetical protein L198_02890 [Cryptococcus wingfieldii CBS 7118]|uniref:Uncharacterized protein n=1 Tax=Cryptococcus wingfieldii CBS 7118 TaxID=1295528 RepID=A0A1E3JI60_9TREE|nr:hypothetical protein L198_02890 [Cryptococcus wingfieldii CBS 7118]ODO00571.1 hypothetical protein L198_02890 [Cryptococcus wingfieldii CBS 7118]